MGAVIDDEFIATRDRGDPLERGSQVRIPDDHPDARLREGKLAAARVHSTADEPARIRKILGPDFERTTVLHADLEQRDGLRAKGLEERSVGRKVRRPLVAYLAAMLVRDGEERGH